MELTTSILEKLNALPIRDIMTFDADGTILARGQKLATGEAMALKQGADALKSNFARKIINEQRIYEAIKIGVYNGINTEQILFAKAALWVIQEEDKLLSKLIEI